ncbi:MAG: hypothetical protein AAGA54_17395 [Myxococcota bacterium]
MSALDISGWQAMTAGPPVLLEDSSPVLLLPSPSLVEELELPEVVSVTVPETPLVVLPLAVALALAVVESVSEALGSVVSEVVEPLVSLPLPLVSSDPVSQAERASIDAAPITKAFHVIMSIFVRFPGHKVHKK